MILLVASSSVIRLSYEQTFANFVIIDRLEKRIGFDRVQRALDRLHEDIDLFARECRAAIAEMKLAYREAREYEARSIRRTRLRALPPPERVRWKRRTCGEASRWRVMT
jgi:hypothetical protein